MELQSGDLGCSCRGPRLGGWHGVLYSARCLLGFSTSLDGCELPGEAGSWAGQAMPRAQGPGIRDEWKSQAQSQVCARAWEDPGVGGRGWAGPRWAARAEAPGRRTRRHQEAAALCRRPEVSEAAPEKGSARSWRPSTPQ